MLSVRYNPIWVTLVARTLPNIVVLRIFVRQVVISKKALRDMALYRDLFVNGLIIYERPLMVD